MSNSLRPHGLHLSITNSCPSSRWCHPTISSPVIPFSSRLQSFPASGSFPMSEFFASRGQSTGASAAASVLPMNIQGWFPLGWTGLISLQSRGLSRVFSGEIMKLMKLLYIFLKRHSGFLLSSTTKSHFKCTLHTPSLWSQVVQLWGFKIRCTLLFAWIFLLSFWTVWTLKAFIKRWKLCFLHKPLLPSESKNIWSLTTSRWLP